jgi:1-acyl-sn-glycerol-3-phosphate acyltransferase
MIPQRENRLIKKLFVPYLTYRLNKAFKVIQHDEVELLSDHSILLLPNHFSWWDGFFAGRLNHTYLKRNFFIMMQEDHLQKRMFFTLLGGFSINPNSKEMVASLQYAAKLLDTPNNLVTIFPQGALQSNHIDEITVERGIDYIVKKIKGNCQIIYYSAFIEYFESLRPSVYIRFLNCGTNHNFDFEKLKAMINEHHKKALKEQKNAEH